MSYWIHWETLAIISGLNRRKLTPSHFVSCHLDWTPQMFESFIARHMYRRWDMDWRNWLRSSNRFCRSRTYRAQYPRRYVMVQLNSEDSVYTICALKPGWKLSSFSATLFMPIWKMVSFSGWTCGTHDSNLALGNPYSKIRGYICHTLLLHGLCLFGNICTRTTIFLSQLRMKMVFNSRC